MRVRPYTSVEIAEGEAVTLALDASATPVAARIVPRAGEASTVGIEGGALAWPRISAPNSCEVAWLDAGGAAICSTRVEVVSRHYFELSDLRGYGDGRDDFASLPEDVLWAARQAATEVFEQAAERSFVLRIGTTTDYGAGGLLMLGHHDVRALLTEGYERASDSQLRRTAVHRHAFPVEVEYVYGLAAIPVEVSRAVLDLAAYTLRPSNRPIGATGESTDAGYIHFTTAGRDGATAIPEVNAAIEMFGAGRRFLW